MWERVDGRPLENMGCEMFNIDGNAANKDWRDYVQDLVLTNIFTVILFLVMGTAFPAVALYALFKQSAFSANVTVFCTAAVAGISFLCSLGILTLMVISDGMDTD